MSGLSINLLGKFAICRDGQNLGGIQAHKVQELFCYLALFNRQPHTRETLCELFWRDHPSTISRKYLRQTLWKLQSALNSGETKSMPDLLVDSEWIQLNPSARNNVDAVDFENAYNLVHDKRVRDMSADDYIKAQTAAALYKGDLLEGWYQDWCIFERERFQMMYIALLDKMVQFCELHKDFESGLGYGAVILRNDRAYERTHRQMMRLYFMSGDRTRALRQYDRCISALRDELNVSPSEKTTRLYEQIRQDTVNPQPAQKGLSMEISDLKEPSPPLTEVLSRLETFSETLTHIQSQLQKEITAIEQTLSISR